MNKKCPKCKPMSIKKDVKEFTSTAVEIAKDFAKTGKLMSSDPEQRMAVCKQCRCFDNGRCSTQKCPGVGCNCWLVVKTKFAGSKCPDGKW